MRGLRSIRRDCPRRRSSRSHESPAVRVFNRQPDLVDGIRVQIEDAAGKLFGDRKLTRNRTGKRVGAHALQRQRLLPRRRVHLAVRDPNGRIEVLIAIGIAAFAIGTSYAIASKSLQQAISARERNQAINVLENQLNALKFREQQTDAATFTSKFSTPVTHFCLDETATDPTIPVSWNPKLNSGAVDSDTQLKTSGSPSYNSACQKDSDYYVDITTLNRGGKVPTVYVINVRWERIGGGPVNEAKVYYRF